MFVLILKFREKWHDICHSTFKKYSDLTEHHKYFLVSFLSLNCLFLCLHFGSQKWKIGLVLKKIVFCFDNCAAKSEDKFVLV